MIDGIFEMVRYPTVEWRFCGTTHNQNGPEYSQGGDAVMRVIEFSD